MHLYPKPRKNNGKTYIYYSIAKSLWNNGSPKKKILLYLGYLTPLEAQQIRNALKITKSPDAFVTKFEDILFKDHWCYLDVAFVSHLWDQWGLSKLFPTHERESDGNGKFVSTSKIAEMLTIYRCLNPGSYLSAVNWFKSTALDLILGVNPDHINKTRIFDELDEIEKCKNTIEEYLYKKQKELDKKDLRIVFYDLTDSRFHGKKCKLAKSGRTKNNGFQSKRIVLALLVNSEGYPFAWDILEDYTADVCTLKGISSKLKLKFKIEDYEVVSVFDRGMVSDENLKYVEDQKQLYITGLDKNQIPNIKVRLFTLKPEHRQYLKKGGISDALRKIFEDNKLYPSDKTKIIQKDDNCWNLQDDKETYVIQEENAQLNVYKNIDLEPFTLLNEEDMPLKPSFQSLSESIDKVVNMGFKKHDDQTYYKELTVLGGRRHVLIFNPEMFLDERKTRKEKIQQGRDYLNTENVLLCKAEKSRNKQSTKEKIDKKLNDMEVHNFIEYDIEPVALQVEDREVNSFKIIPIETEKTEKAIKKAKRTDGLWVVVSNVSDKKEDNKCLTASELIDNYRNKNRVEEAFRDIKSFVEIEPFGVWTENHVRAHYTICVLSYLLDVTVTNKLREHGIKEITSVHKAYEKLKEYEIGQIEVKSTKHDGKKIMDTTNISQNIIELFELFKCEHLITDKHLKSIKISGGSP